MIPEIIKASVSLFIIMDALGLIPIFNILTKGVKPKDRGALIRKAVFVAGCVVLAFLFLGNQLLHYFGIGIPSFKIAGGVLLAILGIEITLGLKIARFGEQQKEISIVPMGTPLIAGPGTITTVLILVSTYGYIVTLISAVIATLVTYFTLINGEKFLDRFGKSGAEVVSKIMGIIIVSIAVEFVIQGILSIP